MTEVSRDEARKFLNNLALQSHSNGVNDGFSMAIECLEAILKESGAHQRIGLALGISALKTTKNLVDTEFPITPKKEGS